jgi:D-alanyl-D-alanine carboxypeptidase
MRFCMPRTTGLAKALATALLALGQTQAAGAADHPIGAATRRAIDAAVAKDRRIFGGATPVPGVLVGVWDGRGHGTIRGYGVADLASKRPIQAADMVRIGSITKTFVVGVMLQLVKEGKLSLDDPIGKFDIGVPVPNAGTITLRDLAQMRSGLPEFFDGPEADLVGMRFASEADLRATLAAVLRKKPASAPGTKYDYCNTNYLLLGLVIEAVTHRDIGTEIRDRLLTPYGLTRTLYPTTQQMPEPWAHGYQRKDKGDWQDVGGSFSVSVSGAAGAMTSDLRDMAQWVRRFVPGKDPRRALECVPTGIGNIAFGLGVVCSAGWYGYTGGLPGYNTATYYSPASKATVVVFVTTQVDDPLPGVANTIFSDIAAIVTPRNRPLVITAPRKTR